MLSLSQPQASRDPANHPLPQESHQILCDSEEPTPMVDELPETFELAVAFPLAPAAEVPDPLATGDVDDSVAGTEASWWMETR